MGRTAAAVDGRDNYLFMGRTAA